MPRSNGVGTRARGLGPSLCSSASFQLYNNWLTWLIARPCRVRVELPETAAHRSSDNQDLAVRGSPTSRQPRLVQREIIIRETVDRSDANSRSIPSFSLTRR